MFIVRLTFLVLILFVCPTPASAGEVEDALEREVAIAFIDAPLRDVVDYLAELLRIPFELVDKKKRDSLVTIQHKHIKVKDALIKILTPLDLRYKVAGDGKRLLIVARNMDKQATTKHPTSK